jgi:succinoglycan biosynthesis protein ExoW
MISVAVVIPFYQRERGILAGALRSVLAQTDLDGVVIHVVDDASPVDPADEIAEAVAALPGCVVLHRKPNGGPGSARNYALDRLRDAEFVAFIDSDDQWAPGHIHDIKQCMAMGGDFYFCDYLRAGATQTQFVKTCFLRDHMIEGDGLQLFAGDLFTVALRGSPIGTSAAGYRFAKMPDLRFPDAWRVAEDTLMWMQIARRAERIYVSPQRRVMLGRGVNIYAGVQWGTTADVVKHRDVANFHTFVARSYQLTDDQRYFNDGWLAASDRNCAKSFISAAVNRQTGCLAAYRSYLQLRPAAWRQLPMALAELVMEKAKALRP